MNLYKKIIVNNWINNKKFKTYEVYLYEDDNLDCIVLFDNKYHKNKCPLFEIITINNCSGSKINIYNIKKGDYLYSEWLYDTLQYKKEELQHKKYNTFFNYLINVKEHYFGETYNSNNGDLSNTELIPLNDKYVELFLQKKELEKQLKEIEMEIIKYF
jgi:hypothetical protein